MTLLKFKPTGLKRMSERSLFSEIERLFGDGTESSIWSSEFQPAIDMFAEDGLVKVKAELPGMVDSDLKVELRDDVLTISGEKKAEKEEKKEGYYCCERTFGSFKRAFKLPSGVDAEKISAAFKDGVLNIEVPLPEEKKAKKVEIKA